MERIPASERTREQLKALMEGKAEAIGSNSDLVRLAARLIIEETLEGEAEDMCWAVATTPGVRRRERATATATGRDAEGAIEYRAPQIADRDEPFRSRIRTLLGKRTAELEAMAVEMYARGLSTRDIEALLADDSGQSLLSRTAVSERDHRAAVGGIRGFCQSRSGRVRDCVSVRRWHWPRT